MKIEHSIPDSARMVTLPTNTVLRIWLPDKNERDRFITIRVVNNEDAVLIEHFQAPGGGSFATAMQLEPNAFNGIVIK